MDLGRLWFEFGPKGCFNTNATVEARAASPAAAPRCGDRKPSCLAASRPPARPLTPQPPTPAALLPCANAQETNLEPSKFPQLAFRTGSEFPKGWGLANPMEFELIEDITSITECYKARLRWAGSRREGRSSSRPAPLPSRSPRLLFLPQNCSWQGVCVRSPDGTKERADRSWKPT